MKPARPLALPLALLIIHLAVRSTGEAPSPQPVQCAAKLAAMSSCLPYVAVAALPENATLTPSAACCQAFAVAIDGAGGGAGCLCDLVRRPFLHGSWLDASRLVSLLSSCGKSISVEASSFAEICQDSLAKNETKFETHSFNSTATADDYDAESGSEGPERRGGGGRRPNPPRPSPSPRRPSPSPSPPREVPEPPPPPSQKGPPSPPPPPPSQEGPPSPPPPPPSQEGPPSSPPPPEVSCPPTPTILVKIISSADGRREMLFRRAVVFFLSIFALC